MGEALIFLLGPFMVLSLVALFLRTRLWGYTVGFMAGSLAAGTALAYCDVYVWYLVDPKFRYAPALAFEIDVAAEGLVSAVRAAALLSLLVAARWLKYAELLPRKGRLCLLVGVAASAVDWGLGWAVMHFEPGTFILWGWIVGSGLLCAFLLLRHQPSGTIR